MFAPNPSVRRVHSEGVVLLGGGRALLMQVAHPLVARGVAEHSGYRRDRLGRLLRTLRPMYAIAFGTPAEGQAAAEGVRRLHAGVVGAGYRANDPALLAWVLATLIDTGLLMYRRFVGPLGVAEAEGYYAGMASMGAVLGMPRTALPGSLREFEAYIAEAVATLEVSDEAREIARDLFSPVPEAPWLDPAIPLVRQLTAGLLPPRLRAQYGMTWGPAREATLRAAAGLSRTVLPALPRSIVAPPAIVMPASYRRSRRRT